METNGPEKALRWLKEDLPLARAAKVVVVEEKEAAVERRKVASAPLLVLACLLGFLSITAAVYVGR